MRLRRLTAWAGVVGVLSMACLVAAVAAQQKPVAAPAAASADVLLGTALHQEEVAGQLEAAIATYRTVLAAPGATREQKARAQFGIGACYERLGNTEARKAYEAVVRDYSDLGDLVKQAQARLAGMGKPATPALRRVASFDGFFVDAMFGRISPDGTSISGVDENGSLVVRSTASGATRTVVPVAASEQAHPAAEGSVWSPDGSTLAYLWRVPGQPATTQPSTTEIRLVPATGGTPKRILSRPSSELFWLCDWSADGRSLLVGSTSSLAIVSLADNAVRPFATMAGGRFAGDAGFSPDGRYVAYSVNSPSEGRQDRDLHVIDRTGGEAAVVAGSAVSEDFVGWVAGGAALLYSMPQGAERGVWSVDVRDGRAVSQPTRVWEKLPLWLPLGIARSGTLAFCVQRPEASAGIQTAALDFKSGRMTSPATAIQAEQTSLSAGWSPDGTQIAYFSNRPSRVVSILDVEKRRSWQIPLPSLTGIGGVSTFGWSPDGLRLRTVGRDEKGRMGLYELEVATGELRTVIPPGTEGLGASLAEALAAKTDSASIIGWSPDGRSIYRRVNHTAKTGEVASSQVSLWERTIDTGLDRELFRSDGPAGIIAVAPSPNGRTLAFVLNEFGPPLTRTLVALSLDVGTKRILARDANLSAVCSWLPDGRALIATVETPGGKVSRAWVYPVDGGQPTPTELARPSLSRIAVHPDGSRVLFASGSADSGTEIWVLENFLPKAGKQ